MSSTAKLKFLADPLKFPAPAHNESLSNKIKLKNDSQEGGLAPALLARLVEPKSGGKPAFLTVPGLLVISSADELNFTDGFSCGKFPLELQSAIL